MNIFLTQTSQRILKYHLKVNDKYCLPEKQKEEKSIIIMKENIKKYKQNNKLQNTYNIVNAILPIISMASVLLGGITAFMYLKTINHVNLLSSLTLMDFASISIFCFVTTFYTWIITHSISFINIYILKEEKDKRKINIKSRSLMIIYITELICIMLLIKHILQTHENNENYQYSTWFNPLIIISIWFYISCITFKKINEYYSNSLPCKIAIQAIISILPGIFILIPLYLIYKLYYNYTDDSFFIILISLAVYSIIGNFITIDIKDRKFKDASYKVIISIMLIIFFIIIPSQLLKTNISYSIISFLGKADKTINPYIIDIEFISRQGIKLKKPVKGNNIYCVKVMFNSGEKYIFTEDSDPPNKYSKYYEIPSKNIELYQGDIICEQNNNENNN